MEDMYIQCEIVGWPIADYNDHNIISAKLSMVVLKHHLVCDTGRYPCMSTRLLSVIVSKGKHQVARWGIKPKGFGNQVELPSILPC